MGGVFIRENIFELMISIFTYFEFTEQHIGTNKLKEIEIKSSRRN